ncbi:hypothetical protein N665_0732s0002 [Sinapis alba]|nr:hypothetical protein N665_0732s0002 [Sinapis alba]
MSTKSIFLPFLLLIIFVSSSQASRQLWDSGFHEFLSKSGFHGINKVHGIHGFHHGTHGIPKFPGAGDIMNGLHTCSMQGPCKGKKLKCPATCYKSTNVNREGYKSTSKSGGCSFDCSTKCSATCAS